MRIDKIKQVRRARRKAGIRKRIFGTPEKPRLTVYRSLQHVYAQVVDDLAGRTLAAANSRQTAAVSGDGKTATAQSVGRAIAQSALAAGVTQVSFDRNGYRYHGRIKAMADAAREAGLRF